MRFFAAASALAIIYFSYGFYLSQFELQILPPSLKNKPNPYLYDYRGVLNVHSDLSIGSGKPAEIVNEAKQAGLDFIFLTDLNNFQNPTPQEGNYNGTLVFSGNKYSFLDSYLIHYSPQKNKLGFSLGEAQTSIADLLTRRPNKGDDYLLILSQPHRWQGEIPQGLDGIEIINLKNMAQSAWMQSKINIILSLGLYVFNPRLSFLRLFNEASDEISQFDSTSLKRKFLAFGNPEASARAIPFGDFIIRFPSYGRAFETVSNHVLLKSELTGNFVGDKQKIFSALKEGHFYIAIDLLADPRGFSAVIHEGQKIHLMGSSLKWKKGQSIEVKLPGRPSCFFEIVLYKDGGRFETSNQEEAIFPLKEPGIYRVQVRVSPYLPLPDAKKWITWIYTNPFYVTP